MTRINRLRVGTYTDQREQDHQYLQLFRDVVHDYEELVRRAGERPAHDEVEATVRNLVNWCWDQQEYGSVSAVTADYRELREEYRKKWHTIDREIRQQYDTPEDMAEDAYASQLEGEIGLLQTDAALHGQPMELDWWERWGPE